MKQIILALLLLVVLCDVSSAKLLYQKGVNFTNPTGTQDCADIVKRQETARALQAAKKEILEIHLEKYQDLDTVEVIRGQEFYTIIKVKGDGTTWQLKNKADLKQFYGKDIKMIDATCEPYRGLKTCEFQAVKEGDDETIPMVWQQNNKDGSVVQSQTVFIKVYTPDVDDDSEDEWPVEFFDFTGRRRMRLHKIKAHHSRLARRSHKHRRH